MVALAIRRGILTLPIYAYLHLKCRTTISYLCLHFSSLSSCIVKLLDWGEEGHRTEAEVASLRAAFTQEVVVWHKLDHPNVTKVCLFVSIFHFVL